jgi:hypothetical protein
MDTVDSVAHNTFHEVGIKTHTWKGTHMILGHNHCHEKVGFKIQTGK